MPIAGQHMEIAAQIFFDGLRLGRRFNDDKLHSSPGSNCLRSEEHTSELQSLMRISYAVFCLKKKIIKTARHLPHQCHYIILAAGGYRFDIPNSDGVKYKSNNNNYYIYLASQ